jgi:hypothetical protein
MNSEPPDAGDEPWLSREEIVSREVEQSRSEYVEAQRRITERCHEAEARDREAQERCRESEELWQVTGARWSQGLCPRTPVSESQVWCTHVPVRHLFLPDL